MRGAGPSLLLLLLLLAAASSLAAPPGSSAPSPASCSLQHTEAGPQANCSYRGLQQVPTDLPPDLVSLNLRGNGLTHLTNTTFSRYTALRRLDVGSNGHLTTIDLHAFYPLVHLQELYLNGGRSLSWTMISKVFQSFQNRSISTINLDRARYTNYGMETPTVDFITANMSRVLADVCVANLNLQDNYLVYADLSPLFHGPFKTCIRYMDLSQNNLEGMVDFLFRISVFKNLERLDAFRKYPMSLITRADIKDNNPFSKQVTHITDTTQKFRIQFPKNLSQINLKGVGGNVGVTFTTEFHAPGLRKAIISRSAIKMFISPVRGLEKLEFLDCSGCDVSLIAPEFFDTFPGLVHLNVSGAFLNQQFLLDWGPRLLQPLTRLQVLDMSDNELNRLPEALFPSTVRRLSLAYNHFSAVPLDVGRLPQLEEVDLTFNAISVLDQTQMAALDGLVSQGRNLSLRLYGNPLACDCSALAFLTWLHTTGVRVDRDGDLPCLTGAKTYSSTGRVLAQAHGRLWQQCTAPLWLTFSGVGLTLLLLVLVLVWLGAKFRTQVQHVLLRLLGVGGAGRGRDHFRYDAYLAHSDSPEDVALAYGPLRRRLEERGGVRLFLREREMLPATLPGASRAEGIVEGVHASWRTLVLLTPHFLQDEWCDFTTAVAVRALDWRTPGRVLLLLAAPLSKAAIPQTLLSAVEEEDVFLVWDKDQDHPVWDRLLDRIHGREGG